MQELIATALKSLLDTLLNKSYIWLEMAGGITLVAHELLIGHKALCLFCLLLHTSLIRFGNDFQTYIGDLVLDKGIVH